MSLRSYWEGGSQPPGALTDDEYVPMTRRPLIGANMLEEGESDLLRMAERIARSHHERWDGGDCPDGLAGEEVQLAARIVSVADAFDVIEEEAGSLIQRLQRRPFAGESISPGFRTSIQTREWEFSGRGL
ncbi:MAG: HD-GYP domain-containing protein [Salinibacter sp.]